MAMNISPASASDKSVDHEKLDIQNRQSWTTRTREAFKGDVNSANCHWPMIYSCFITGFVSSVSFSACYIWCGFQTGGVAQLGLALARNYAPLNLRTYIFEKPDQQALVSLICFLIGASLGRFGDKMGNKSRKWLVSATVMQALMLMAAALLVHAAGEPAIADSRGTPSWNSPMAMAGLGFASASLGLQGFVGKRLNTQLATAVVLTTVWVELATDPLLLSFKKVNTRDHKAAGVGALFLGAVIGRTILDVIGSAGTFGIAAGLRMVLNVWWFYV